MRLALPLILVIALAVVTLAAPQRDFHPEETDEEETGPEADESSDVLPSDPSFLDGAPAFPLSLPGRHARDAPAFRPGPRPVLGVKGANAHQPVRPSEAERNKTATNASKNKAAGGKTQGINTQKNNMKNGHANKKQVQQSGNVRGTENPRKAQKTTSPPSQQNKKNTNVQSGQENKKTGSKQSAPNAQVLISQGPMPVDPVVASSLLAEAEPQLDMPRMPQFNANKQFGGAAVAGDDSLLDPPPAENSDGPVQGMTGINRVMGGVGGQIGVTNLGARNDAVSNVGEFIAPDPDMYPRLPNGIMKPNKVDSSSSSGLFPSMNLAGSIGGEMSSETSIGSNLKGPEIGMPKISNNRGMIAGMGDSSGSAPVPTSLRGRVGGAMNFGGDFMPAMPPMMAPPMLPMMGSKISANTQKVSSNPILPDVMGVPSSLPRISNLAGSVSGGMKPPTDLFGGNFGTQEYRNPALPKLSGSIAMPDFNNPSSSLIPKMSGSIVMPTGMEDSTTGGGQGGIVPNIGVLSAGIGMSSAGSAAVAV